LNYSCLSQTNYTDTLKISTCADKWQYFELKKPLTGQVVKYTKSGSCGTLAFASIAIIKLPNNDTVRVLELCNDEKEFQYNQSVIVSPGKRPAFGVSFPLLVTDQCIILKTCYGIMTSIK
jgi:hypothetical protein